MFNISIYHKEGDMFLAVDIYPFTVCVYILDIVRVIVNCIIVFRIDSIVNYTGSSFQHFHHTIKIIFKHTPTYTSSYDPGECPGRVKFVNEIQTHSTRIQLKY